VEGEAVIVQDFDGSISLVSDRQPWERQPEESDGEWAAFRAWRDLDPHERTYKNAFNLLHSNGNKPDLAESTIIGKFSKVATRNRWRERVNAYDQHVDAKIRENLEARRIRARLETADLGRSMRMKAKEAVDALKSIVMVEENGKLVPRSSLSPADITRLAKVGRELESVALEGGVQGAVGMNLGIQINIGDSELRQQAKDIIETQEEVVNVTSQMIDVKSGS
jgi:hypothetical protein